MSDKSLEMIVTVFGLATPQMRGEGRKPAPGKATFDLGKIRVVRLLSLGSLVHSLQGTKRNFHGMFSRTGRNKSLQGEQAISFSNTPPRIQGEDLTSFTSLSSTCRRISRPFAATVSF